ncbi:hypothetical protein AAIG99_31445, partial [Pseudomonas aeruginosa]
MQTQELKAYQVGDNDIVAAYDPAGAIQVLCKQGGYADDDFTVDDVELVDARLLKAPMRDEEGNEYPPLRVDLDAAT